MGNVCQRCGKKVTEREKQCSMKEMKHILCPKCLEILKEAAVSIEQMKKTMGLK